ncbi:MAG: MFS transporter [Planctomycetes bacterium]|nr:MFS transporter [Planctomycetota bacterium]
MTTTPQLTRSAEALAVAALTLVGFAIALNVQVLAALGPFLDAELELEDGEFGSLVATGWIAGAVGSLVLLPVVDRIGRRTPILLGGVVFGVASAWHLAVRDASTLLLVRAIAGFAGGGVFTVASAAVADLVPYDRRARAMGIFNLSIFLAAPIGMPIATACAEAGSWQAIFGVQVVATVLALAGAFYTLPSDIGRGGESLDIGVLRLPSVGPALLSVVLYSGAFATTVQFLGIWLDSANIVPKEEQEGLWLTLGLVSAVGTIGLTRFADAIGKRRFIVLTSVVVATGLACLPSVDSLLALTLVGAPIAACTAARSGAMLALITGLAPSNRRGALMVWRSVAVSAGMGVIVYVGGVVHRHTSGFDAIFWFAAGSVALSLLLVLACVREVGR